MLQAPLKSAREVAAETADILRPPRRVRPSQAAAEVLRSEKGPWLSSLVPYCTEPLDYLAGREYRGIVFVGPSRTGKTMGLILGGISYIVTAAPGDMLVVQMSQEAARDFSRMDLDRAIRHSPAIRDRVSQRARDDNIFDKYFRSGIALKLGWPAISQLSAKTLQYVFVTDYDRPKNADNVDGEGRLWDLALKRTETYMSRGKCVAESSPGEDLFEPRFEPRTEHEAPPARGILAIYNEGTRARWYWPCQHCGEHFQAAPGLDPFDVPEFDELCELVKKQDISTLANEFARVVCPHCGGLHEPEQRQEMNRAHVNKGRIRGATWLHDGEQIVDGRIKGERRRSQIVSYWLGGVAAVYQTWPSILQRYLQAVRTYTRTGDEGPLRTTTNTDQGAPYMPRVVKRRRTGADLMKRLESWPRGEIPAGVRFLTAAVDVQLYRFVVTVMGWGEGLESWLIDRYSLTASARPEGEKFAALEPASYAEDWLVLVDQVVRRSYKTENGFELEPRLTLCDSGGKAGVTDKAYEFWRVMRGRGLGKKIMLVKGTGNLNAPRISETWPDARARKDRTAGRGDVLVWLLNVNSIKDGVAGDLSRDDPGPGFVHLPDWLDDQFFIEISAESRGPRGWTRDGKTPNEAFDLHTYNRAACIILKAEAINWKRPPKWATELSDRETDKPAEATKTKTSRPPAKRNWTSEW